MKKITPILIALLISISGTIRAEQTIESNKAEIIAGTEGPSNALMNENTPSEEQKTGEVKYNREDSTQLTKDGGDPVVIYVSSGVVLVLVIILLIILL